MRLRNVLASCAFALALPFAAHAAPLEAYTKLPALEQPKISPTGDRFAYMALVGDKRVLAVQTFTGQNLGGASLGDQKVRAIQWIDNGHLLISVEKYFKLDEDSSNYSTLLVYDVAGKKFIPLLDHPGVAAPIEFGHEIRIVNGQPTLYVETLDRNYHPQTFKVDLTTGHGDPDPEADGILDDTGKAVFREQYYKESGHWRVTSRDGIAWKEIWNRDGFAIDRPSLLGAGRTPDTVLISVPENGARPIYEVSKDGRAVKLKFEDKGGDVSPVYQTYTGKLIGFVSETDDDENYVFLDPQTDGVWNGIVNAFPHKHVTLASRTPDFSKVIIHTEGEGDSGTFYLIDNTSHKAVKVGADYPDVKAADLAEERFIHYKAADGTIIPAYLTLPKGRDPKNLPLVVLPHGGPQGRDEPGFDFFSQTIASRGYAVLQPEFRGSDGFGVKHLEAGYGQWGRKMQTDLSDGVRHLAAEGTIDPKRVCIFGWSYGGYAALAGPTLDPGVYRCAIAGAPVSDLPAMLNWEKELTGQQHDSVVMRYEKRYMGASGPGDPKLVEISPDRHVDQVNVPILLIHGKEDTTVPYNQSELMQQALLRAGKQVQLVTLTGEDHHLSKGKTRQEAMTAVVTFLEKNNPPT